MSSDPDVHRVDSPECGDLVRFKFDHVGMFVRHVDAGHLHHVVDVVDDHGIGHGREGIGVEF